MDKIAWKNRIVKACKSAGTYQPCFDGPIDTLAWILAERDTAIEQYEDSGGGAVVEHTNRGGATNLEKNPALRLINEFNRDALTYWRDLGLTPKGLRAIDDAALKSEKKSAFADALEKAIGG